MIATLESGIELDTEEAAILSTVATLYRQSNADLMSARMEMGRLCSQLIAKRMAKGFSPMGTRYALANYLAATMKNSLKPGWLITVYQSVRLLGEGHFGGLGWCAAKEFHVFARCDKQTETWSLYPDTAEQVKELFVRAAAEGFTREQVRSAVTDIRGRLPQYNQAKYADDHKPQKTLRLPMSKQRMYTTGQVSRIVGVAARTVSKWCDNGSLRCHRIPDSNDRRISRAALAEFIAVNDVGVSDPLLLGGAHVVTYGLDDATRKAVDAGAGNAVGWPVETSHFDNVWELAHKIGGMLTPLAVLDVAAGMGSCLQILEGLRREAWVPRAVVLDDEIEDNAVRLMDAGAHTVLRQPVSGDALALVVQDALTEILR